MVNINLIGKRRREAKSKNWIILGVISLFGLYVLYFLSISGYVIVKLTLLKNEQVKVDQQTESISREMTANNDLLKNFVLSKFILGKIEALNRDKFPYKSLLDQLVAIMPTSVVMRNVDFSNKGWVAVTASIQGVKDLSDLENNLKNANLISASPFNSVFAETVTKEKNGLYTAKLQFEIKKNGG